MKKINYFTVIILLIISASCKGIKNPIYDRNNSSKEKWIRAFKEEVFYECLKSNFKNDSIFILIRKEDFFDSSDFLTFPVIDKTKTIANEYMKTIPKWEAHNDNPNESIYKKPTFSYCLEYFKSKKLDSIARSTYKIN